MAAIIETQRVEFLGEATVGDRTYVKGDVGEIPTDRLKALGKLVRSTSAELTDFSPAAEAPPTKPAKAK